MVVAPVELFFSKKIKLRLSHTPYRSLHPKDLSVATGDASLLNKNPTSNPVPSLSLDNYSYKPSYICRTIGWFACQSQTETLFTVG